jgi:D-alanyl-D-alanine carboxypeptidase-like protein
MLDRVPRKASGLVTALLSLIMLAACSADPAPTPRPTGAAVEQPSQAPQPTPNTSTNTITPVWQVGATPLPLRPDGFGKVLPTPPELVDRNLPSPDLLPPPANGQYAATVAPVPAGVLARSTWDPKCPVTVAELRYLTLSFWGFDGRAHTGELLVNAKFAEGITTVFRTLFNARFPIEAMTVTSRADLDAPPTGDGNGTSGFACRPKVGQTEWSAHAYGLAIDVNPFCNPYVKGDLVLPELASSYVDRRNRRPGMIFPGDATIKAFAAIGWSWGGDWTSPRDLQHFTANGH